MRKSTLVFGVLVFFFCSCRSQTNRQIIEKTAQEVIVALRHKNSSDFKRLIGVDNLRVIGKDDESIEYDVIRYSDLIKKGFRETDEVPFDITGLFNEIGQTVVRIKFPKSVADSLGVKSLHLNLYFGPPQIISLKKISGYDLIENDSDSTDFKKQ